ncbi:MAG TPA: hypothetical protein RMH85_29880 [Polyangiaceae bacterium LLY-WYZ-15_(1-7)]|nr:hypothetical protein [Myxococcales bacterium]MAT24542.1 hypothetical protein [Sandaracinus sp.]HJK90510.1 hypothetical protein [Polyangiaceae bacterium LLY-WYZ-15_(1-7)]MBJ71470.1 hypothetical protein [Sandaracinus sp.]HJL03626.1 hypothetical protein [Polyangiaceae bacterium LLY-WYZ-15_(1-7)]
MARLDTSLRLLGALSLAAFAGCSLADPSLLDALRDGSVTPGEDGGPPGDGGGVDAGTDAAIVDTSGAVSECGADGVRVFADTVEDVRIDTRAFRNDVGSLPSCGQNAPGPDAFFAVDVQAGEYWHFHLRVDGENDPEPTARNPVLYLLNESCAPTMCTRELLANFCGEEQDEHFAFTFTEAGRWYIGIDSGVADGGVYLLDAIRPVCGDGTPDHGEACDGQEGCSDDCHWLLNEESVRERGFNFNEREANLVDLPASGELEIRGDIGGFACEYPDVFAIDVPENSRLQVQARDGSGTPCTGGTAEQFTLTLQNARGDVRGGDVMDGCPFIDTEFTGSGRFFVFLEDQRPDTSRALQYRLFFRLTDL